MEDQPAARSGGAPGPGDRNPVPWRRSPATAHHLAAVHHTQPGRRRDACSVVANTQRDLTRSALRPNSRGTPILLVRLPAICGAAMRAEGRFCMPCSRTPRPCHAPPSCILRRRRRALAGARRPRFGRGAYPTRVISIRSSSGSRRTGNLSTSLGWKRTISVPSSRSLRTP